MNKKSNLIISGAILLAGILIGGYFVLQARSGSADFSQTLASLFQGVDEKNQNEKTRDQDNDGLTDWQEEIYKTNPLNYDTDGDGYLDGEEVLSGYDPTKPAPDDKLSETAINPRPSPGSFVGVNLTEELGKSILENIQANPSAALSDEATMDLQANDLITNALATALAKSPNLNYIPDMQDANIIIQDKNDQQAVAEYAAKMSQALNKFLSPEQGINGAGLEAAAAAIEKNNYSEIEKYINAYKNSFQSAKEVPVPADWKEIHKGSLKFLLGSANVFEAIKNSQEDPLRSLIAIQQYQQLIGELKSMTENIGNLLTQ